MNAAGEESRLVALIRYRESHLAAARPSSTSSAKNRADRRSANGRPEVFECRGKACPEPARSETKDSDRATFHPTLASPRGARRSLLSQRRTGSGRRPGKSKAA